ncbi:MAG: hypothetical protein R2850_05990 [Bacteroidia bacterium]
MILTGKEEDQKLGIYRISTNKEISEPIWDEVKLVENNLLLLSLYGLTAYFFINEDRQSILFKNIIVQKSM